MRDQNPIDPRATIKHLRETAAARVENTSLRSVAREIGMSPTGLKKFLMGTAPYSPTLRRLRHWFLQHGASQTGELNAEEASAALTVLVHDLAPDARHSTTQRLVDTMGRGYEESGKVRPGWLSQLAERLAAEAAAQASEDAKQA